ncbi:uncharacterized protein DSM5745_08062 [Aspergillus mulundensis]|uniref:Uncharacterized protein n=1 Tax=Aspergillus mulundensis TaxID=1810919 RepID=A0A3D8R9I7_9EURO|nr:Uncharacterized protein DSM5745_08062 [Aspergillus mulundensis]RDW70551.1 Uncharacterized protein DSM5745_08062 [Aspergillus mulundensis]
MPSSTSATWPNFTPRWGRLPIEQYLIRHWNHSSPEPNNQQRLRLIHAYIHLDKVPQEWDPTDFGEAWYEPDPNDTNRAFGPTRIPTDTEIEVILRPWRSHDLRKRAWEIWCGRDRGYPVMLRTYYDGEEGGAKFTEYTRVSETYHAVTDCLALCDAQLFNFGSEWRRVFDILPEIAGCRGHQTDYDASDINNVVGIGRRLSAYYPRRPDRDMLEDDYAELEDEIENSKAECPDWKENPDILLEPGDTAIRSLLRTATISWVIVVDEKAFRTDELLVIYFDMYQDVTVEGRLGLDQGYLDEMLMRWEDGGRPLGFVMENGTVGERYRLSNESGRRFFRLSDDYEHQAGDAKLQQEGND